MVLTIQSRIVRNGNSVALAIPKAYVNKDLLSYGKTYQIDIKSLQEAQQKIHHTQVIENNKENMEFNEDLIKKLTVEEYLKLYEIFEKLGLSEILERIPKISKPSDRALHLSFTDEMDNKEIRHSFLHPKYESWVDVFVSPELI